MIQVQIRDILMEYDYIIVGAGSAAGDHRQRYVNYGTDHA